MGLKYCFGLLEQEEWDIPSKETLDEIIKELEAKLLIAKGSERTKLTYMLANQLMFLNQITSKKKPKKPIKMNNKGKWVWVEDG